MSEATRQESTGEKSNYQLTRELELLISAGLVFALIQLPTLLERWWNTESLRVAGPSFAAAFVVYYAGKLVSYSLIVAISFHFFLRSFWVAIMGLRSIFGGPDLSKLDAGPLMGTFYERKLITLDALEERVDRLAGSVFSFFFLVLLLFTMLAFNALLGWLAAVVVAALTGNEELFGKIFAVVFIGTMLFNMSVNYVDLAMKKGKAPLWLQRYGARALPVIHYITLNFLYAPVFLTFATRVSRKITNTVLIVSAYAMIAWFAFNSFAAKGLIGFDSYSYFPRGSSRFQMKQVHYESVKPADIPVAVPLIQSQIVEGPYVRLFIPYNPRTDNDRMRALCRGVASIRDEGVFFGRPERLPDARLQGLMQCFAKLHQITLDGRPLPNLPSHFFVHPHGDIPGRMVMIPATGLAPGPHLLTTREVEAGRSKKRPYEAFITFWR